MFVVMAMNAQILPVAAIGRIIIVIAVLVMNGQQIQGGRIKLTATLGADWPVDLQRPGPVVGFAVNLASHPLEDGSSLIGARQRDCSGAS